MRKATLLNALNVVFLDLKPVVGLPIHLRSRG